MGSQGGNWSWDEDKVGSGLGSPLGSSGRASGRSSRVRALLEPMLLTTSLDEADEVAWLRLIDELAHGLLDR